MEVARRAGRLDHWRIQPSILKNGRLSLAWYRPLVLGLLTCNPKQKQNILERDYGNVAESSMVD